METAIIIALLCSLFALVLLLLFLLQDKRKKERLLEQKKRELTHLEQQFSMLLERHRQLKEFRNNMDEAALTTRLQAGRLPHSSAASHHTSERYRFILALAEKGMESAEIASSLSVSHQEVEQVIALSSLSKS